MAKPDYLHFFIDPNRCIGCQACVQACSECDTHRGESMIHLEYVDRTQQESPDTLVTIVLPEFLPVRWWQQLLHNQTALLIKGAMLFRRGVVVIDVPYHLASKTRGPDRGGPSDGSATPEPRRTSSARLKP